MKYNINEVIDNIVNKMKEKQVSIKSETELENSDEPSIYYMLHIDNLDSILKKGFLSHNLAHKLANIKDISNIDVNNRRGDVKFNDGRSLHDYVPFYFNPRNAMLYSTQSRFSDNIIILELNIRPLLKYIYKERNNEFLFSDGNASREDTSFYDAIEDLLDDGLFNFSDIYQTHWYNDTYVKSKMMSEVLIYNNIPINFISYIHAQTKEIADDVIQILKNELRGKDECIFNLKKIWYGRGYRTVFFGTELVV
ncbi:DUF4433 domain-containing protein [Haemophilus parahaemolyticus]|uniref:DUF4433 domain-containing protein n=1 Tax=Haemophilus parahaemolyticus TaxID=735 RepID=UPI0028D1280F|nr:DUF4433 domain-containing protein [Haemophilus parahaemolyticus]